MPQGSIQARLDAFMAGKGGSRTGCHATETGPASGFAWLSNSDNVAFISDGILSMAVQGTAQGLLEDSGEDGLTGAEVSQHRYARVHPPCVSHTLSSPCVHSAPPGRCWASTTTTHPTTLSCSRLRCSLVRCYRAPRVPPPRTDLIPARAFST